MVVRGGKTLRRLFLCAVTASQFSASPASAHAPPATPTVSEMETLVRSEWPYFRNRIRTDDGLAAEPERLTSVPHTLCQPAYDGHFFECATLVLYELPSGRTRSSLVRHNVERDGTGRLQTAIVISERPLQPK